MGDWEAENSEGDNGKMRVAGKEKWNRLWIQWKNKIIGDERETGQMIWEWWTRNVGDSFIESKIAFTITYYYFYIG